MGCVTSRGDVDRVRNRPNQIQTEPPEDPPELDPQSLCNFEEEEEAIQQITPSPSRLPGISPVPSFFNPEKKPTIFEYEFIRHIGHGAQSDVFLCQNTVTNEPYAAKVYDKCYLYRTSIGDSEPPIQKLCREVEIMKSLSHPNCLQLVEVLDDQVTNTVVLILPFADAGALSSYSWRSDKISEKQAQDYFAQIARGLQHIHSHNIIHRDLKPDNILKFSNGQVALADFSVSKFLEQDDEMCDDTDGTPAYYSPEECGGEPYFGKPADVWAYGMMIYVMIYGRLPFFETDDQGVSFSQFYKVSHKIMNEEFDYPQEVPISDNLRDLFKHVLDKNPKTRYTIDQVLEHPWLKDVPDLYIKAFMAEEAKRQE